VTSRSQRPTRRHSRRCTIGPPSDPDCVWPLRSRPATLRDLDLANLGTACADAVASCFRDSAGIRSLDCRVPRRSQTWRSSHPAPATPGDPDVAKPLARREHSWRRKRSRRAGWSSPSTRRSGQVSESAGGDDCRSARARTLSSVVSRAVSRSSLVACSDWRSARMAVVASASTSISSWAERTSGDT